MRRINRRCLVNAGVLLKRIHGNLGSFPAWKAHQTRMPRVEAAHTEDLPGFEITQSFNQDIEIYGLRRQ